MSHDHDPVFEVPTPEEIMQEELSATEIADFTRAAVTSTKDAALSLLSNDDLELFARSTVSKIKQDMTGEVIESFYPSFYVVSSAVVESEPCEHEPKLSDYQQRAMGLARRLYVDSIHPDPRVFREDGASMYLSYLGETNAKQLVFPLAICFLGQAMTGLRPSKKKLETQGEGEPITELTPQPEAEEVLSLPKIEHSLVFHGLTIDGRLFGGSTPFAVEPGQEGRGVMFEETNFFFSHNPPSDDNVLQISSNIQLLAFYYGYFKTVRVWHQNPGPVKVLQTLLNVSLDHHANYEPNKPPESPASDHVECSGAPVDSGA